MPTTKFAHFFNEGAGHLFVADLAAGTQGETFLVRSVADGKIYVRKRTYPFYGAPVAALPVEVRLYTPHEYIPTLIDWTDFKLPTLPSEPHEPLIESTAIWKFCNGGNLAEFMYKFNSASPSHIDALDNCVPEVVIWRFFDQMLQTLSFLQHCLPPRAHRDLGEANIFLHWPSDESEVPDFYVGDFGHSRAIDLSRPVAEPGVDASTLDRPRPPKIFSNDLRRIRDHLQDLMQRKEHTFAPGKQVTYSPDLYDCCDSLRAVAAASEESGGTVPDLTALRQRVSAAAASRLSSDAIPPSLRLTRPALTTTPKLYDTKAAIARAREPPGPWQIATVNPSTFSIHSLDDEIHNFATTPPPSGHAPSPAPSSDLTSPEPDSDFQPDRVLDAPDAALGPFIAPGSELDVMLQAPPRPAERVASEEVIEEAIAVEAYVRTWLETSAEADLLRRTAEKRFRDRHEAGRRLWEEAREQEGTRDGGGGGGQE